MGFEGGDGGGEGFLRSEYFDRAIDVV